MCACSMNTAVALSTVTRDVYTGFFFKHDHFIFNTVNTFEFFSEISLPI